MKNTIIFALALVFNLHITAQVKQDRKVAHFSSLNVSSAIKVVLTMSDNESLVFEAEEKVLPKLKAEVKNDVLHIYAEGSTSSSKGMTAYISAKTLKGLVVHSAASIEATNAVNADNLKLEANSAGSIDLNVTASELDVKSSGAGSVHIKGNTKKLMLDLSGASSFKGKELVAASGDVKASGASSAKVNVTQSIKAVATGASEVIYTGNPKDVTVDATGASSIEKG